MTKKNEYKPLKMVIVGFYSTYFRYIFFSSFLDYYADQKREDIGHWNATNKRNEHKKTKENNNNKMIEIQTKFLLLNEFTTEETKKKCETKIVIH